MKKILFIVVLIIIFSSYAFYLGFKRLTTLPSGISNITHKNTINVSTNPTIVVKQEVIPLITPQQNSSFYKDGIYTGIAADAVYGNIQVRTTISNGRITHVQFLQYPSDQVTSVAINQYADPKLAEEAIQAQSSNVDIISSASYSSQAFIQSFQSTLELAKR